MTRGYGVGDIVLQWRRVYKKILTAVAVLGIASSLGATPAKTHKRRHAAKSVSASSLHKVAKAATKTSSAKTTSARSKKSSSTRRKGTVTRRVTRYYQQAPTPDRYKEIQQALASKGYFQGEPNGAWGSDSIDALKRFQADQNLMPDGKISSLSLIALGLGPKRLTAKSDAAPALPSAPQAGTPAPSSPNPAQ